MFSLFHDRDKTKNILLYFFTELKTYHLSYSIHIIVVHVASPFTPKNNFCLLTHVSWPKQIMQTTCSSLIKFSSVTFWPIRRFKKQKPVKEVEPFTCYWSKFKGYSVKVPSVLLLYVQTFRTESGCVSLSVSRKLSSSKQWPQKQVRILISSKMHQCCLIELTGLGLYHNFFQQSMLQLHRIPPTF